MRIAVLNKYNYCIIRAWFLHGIDQVEKDFVTYTAWSGHTTFVYFAVVIGI